MPDLLQPHLATSTAARHTADRIVEAAGLSKTYAPDGAVPVRALDGINLTLRGGDFTVIAGPSGSGKTTLLNLFGGLDQPTEGSVKVAGLALAQMDRSMLADFRLYHIGMLFQANNLVPVLTAWENAAFTLSMQGLPAAELDRRVAAVLEALEVPKARHTSYPHALSMEERLRVALARALAANPRLVLADEPTANLSTEAGLRLIDRMKALSDETGMTFVLTSHDPVVIERAGRRIELQDGRLVHDSEDD